MRFRKIQETIFEISVVLDEKHQGSRGSSHGDFDQEVYYSIKGDCIEALQNELLDECKRFNLPVKQVVYKRCDFGSLDILFSVVWDTAQLLSGALTIYDAIKVVSILAEKITIAAIESRHNRWRCHVSCKQIIPSLDNELMTQNKMIYKYIKQYRNCLIVVIALLTCILTIELIKLLIVLAALI